MPNNVSTSKLTLSSSQVSIISTIACSIANVLRKNMSMMICSYVTRCFLISLLARCTRNMVSEPRHGLHLLLDCSPERYGHLTMHGLFPRIETLATVSIMKASQRIRALQHTRCLGTRSIVCSGKKGRKSFAKFENSRNSRSKVHHPSDIAKSA